jgi:hypothetical protein
MFATAAQLSRTGKGEPQLKKRFARRFLFGCLEGC